MLYSVALAGMAHYIATSYTSFKFKVHLDVAFGKEQGWENRQGQEYGQGRGKARAGY